MTTQLPTGKDRPSADLYEQDYVLWLAATIEQLRKLAQSHRPLEERGRHCQAIDWENLLEELASLSRREKREVSSRLNLILIHLLKWVYQPGMRPYYGNSWINTIDEQRDELKKVLQDSPSLNNYLRDNFDEWYTSARQRAAKQTGLPLSNFPATCPFTPQEALNPDYLPD